MIGAEAELLALAEMLQAPVISTKHGKGAISDRHYLAQTSVGGAALWPDVDVVLAVGTRLLDPYLYWGIDDGIKIIRIDIDPVQIDKPGLTRYQAGDVGEGRPHGPRGADRRP